MSRGRGSGTRQSPMMRARWPCRHDHDAVGERDRLFEIVGDEQHRLAVGIPQFQQQVAHDLPGLRVERAERLVHQKDFWIADQDLREADALALPARQHVRITVGERAEADGSEPALRALQRLLARRALDVEANGDIVDRGLPGKQRIGLKQIAGIPVQPRQRLTENLHRPRGGLQKPGRHVEQRRFPAAGRADNGDELAMGDRQAGPLHGCVDTIPGHAKGHRRIVERHRDWLFVTRHVSPQDLERCLSGYEG